MEEFWIGWVEKAALLFLMEPSETVVGRAVGGALGSMGGAVVISYSGVRAVVGLVVAREVVDAGGSVERQRGRLGIQGGGSTS